MHVPAGVPELNASLASRHLRHSTYIKTNNYGCAGLFKKPAQTFQRRKWKLSLFEKNGSTHLIPNSGENDTFGQFSPINLDHGKCVGLGQWGNSSHNFKFKITKNVWLGQHLIRHCTNDSSIAILAQGAVQKSKIDYGKGKSYSNIAGVLSAILDQKVAYFGFNSSQRQRY